MERLITNIKRQGTGELGGVFLENKKDKEAERINPYILEFNEFGEVNFECDKESVLGKMEYEGMKSMRELAVNGEKYLIWLSPPKGASSYTEGRVVVGKVLETDGEVKIECRGIPLLQNREKFREIADSLGREDVEIEDLRKEAIGVESHNDAEFWDKCEEVFGVKEVWNYIREGKDKENKVKVENFVEMAVEEIRVRGYENKALALEMIMRSRWGYEIVGGNHGGTNMDLFGGVKQWGAFSMIFNQSELKFRVEKVNGKLVCPCGETLAEGTSRCPKCGIRLSQNDIS